jgi:hypothetical protein
MGRFIGRSFLVALGFTLLLAIVPATLNAGMKHLTTPSSTPSAVVASPGAPKVAASPSSSPTVVAPPSPTDCSTASGAEVGKIIGTKVQPIATTDGCAWGTRLDDPSTALVTIRMSARHAAYDYQLETSVKQRRVVYGGSVDAKFRSATALWVAAGQPITKGKSGVTARADTKVVVATKELGIGDDRARSMALAIAAAANS